MNNRTLAIVGIIFLFFSVNIFGQVSNVKLDNDVYKYLSNLSSKGLIDYDDLVKPLSRRYIAKKLIEARANFPRLTNLQKDELKFYESEYGYEIEKINSNLSAGAELEIKTLPAGRQDYKMIGKELYSKDLGNTILQTDTSKKVRDLLDKSWEIEERKPLAKEVEKGIKTDLESEIKDDWVNEDNDWVKGRYGTDFVEYDELKRWRFFNYQNENINLNINPIAGYEIGNWNKKNYNNFFAGVNFDGEIGDIVGFNFELYHTRQTPGNINYLYNNFTKKTKFDVFLQDRERMENSRINVDIGFSWDWGTFTIGKNHLNWGYAENGKIVLSKRAPSFPYIRLDLKPADWLTFNYIHAWLNSDVIDSNAFYSTWRVRGDYSPLRINYIQKYLAMHSVTFSFLDGIDLSVGESIVYADQLQIAYLIPIMFFDMTDEYLSRVDNYAGGSTQLFLALSSRNHVPNTHLYGSFHADELTPEGLFDPATQYYKFAFTLGAETIDLPIDNLGVTIEYTKIYPGNYRHFIPTLTYESSSTLMGHWMGDNGDLFYGSLDYTVFRGLKVKLWTQHIRKGTEALGNRAYKEQIPQPGFLFTDRISDRKNYSYYGFDVTYEILHDVWVKGHFQYIDYEQQISENKFRSQLNRDIAFSFGYGI